MTPIVFIERTTGQQEEEQVYGGTALELLYGTRWASRLLGRPLAILAARLPFLSALYGWWQSLPFTKRKVAPFVQKYKLHPQDFLKPVDRFTSFNDFFIRKLKLEARPIVPESNKAMIPADGRYLFYPNVETADGFVLKGKRFDLAALIGDADLASRYAQGSMVIARLCPVDYHRFHFPCEGIPQKTRMINGWLYSVNPIALRYNLSIFTENKRAITVFQSDTFGDILYMEIGATNVGSIHQTYIAEKKVKKGEEKGFFSFGASALVLLFLPGKIQFDADLIEASRHHMEIHCLMGQSMGQCPPNKMH